jgi:diadenosine tetraphosphate (Ap4A) HIT family hydrolase
MQARPSPPIWEFLTVATPSIWQLHPQLVQDTHTAGDLPLSRVLVSKDANYPWLLLVPRRLDVCEIIDLEEADQSQLAKEISQVARALKTVTRCDKLNIAAIGNVVPQLHVHIVARRHSDVAWPKPVWGAAPPLAYDPDELTRFIAVIQHAAGLA